MKSAQRSPGRPTHVVSLIVAADQDEIYGGERSAMATLGELKSAGYVVHILTTGGQKMHDLATQNGLEISGVRLKTTHVQFRNAGFLDRFRKLRAFVSDWLMLRGKFREFGADLVHVNDISPAGQVGVPAARLARLPCVIHVRTEVSELRKSHRLMMWLADASVTVSPAVLTIHLAAISGLRGGSRIARRAVALSNGVDLKRSPSFGKAERQRARAKLGISSEAFVALNVGSFEPRKRQQFLIGEVLPRLFEAAPNAETFFVGGTKSLHQRYLDQCSETRLKLRDPERCHLVEYTDQIGDYYAACDVVFLGSLIEGLPRTVLEAMAAGRLVVATVSPGSQELVADRESGFLIDSNDNGSSFARTLADVAAMDARSRDEMGTLGRARVEAEYDIISVARRFAAIVDAATSRG